MFCPECNHDLLPIALNTKVSQVSLDYCKDCGGVWSDQGEINLLQLEDLPPLFQVLPKKPITSSIKLHLCPKDRGTLELFRGESVPADLAIYRCPYCSGIFFPTHTLERFKKAQGAKINYFKLWHIPLHSIYAILLPLLLILIVGGGLVATLSGVKQGTDVRTKAHESISKPLVFSPSPGIVLISFFTESETRTKLKYWTRPDVVTEVWVSATPKQQHTVKLRNLELGRSYSYQIFITEPETFTSPVYLFDTK